MGSAATFPASVWDGDSDSRDLGNLRAPDYRDWNRAVSEIAATQTELNVVKGVSVQTFANDQGSAIVICQPTYISAAGKVKLADADSASTAKVAGLAIGVTTAHLADLTVRGQGEFSATAAQWDNVTGGSGGLTSGAIYYLDPGTAGKLTATRPTVSGDIVVEVGLALSTILMSIRINIIETTTTELRNDVDALEAGYLIEINDTGTVAVPNELAATESRTVLTNEATLTEKNSHLLPTAAEGVTFTFICRHTDGIRIVANTSDTIRVGSEVTKTAGYVESIVIGSTVILVAVNTVEWIAIQFSRTWVVETS